MYRLDENCKRLYQSYLAAMQGGRDKIDLNMRIDENMIIYVYKLALGSGLLQTVLYDTETVAIYRNPLLGYIKSLGLKKQFHKRDEEHNLRAFVQKADSVLSMIRRKGQNDEVLLIKGVYDYIAQNVNYDYSSRLSSHSAWGALINGEAVCEGVSFLVSYLLGRLGVECGVIQGEMRGLDGSDGPHMWNLIRLKDGAYYHLDVTSALSEKQFIVYDMFLVRDSDMKRYMWDHSLYQRCDGAYDHYKQNGFYANNLIDFKQVVKKQIRDDLDIVRVKISEKLAAAKNVDELLNEAVKIRSDWTKDSCSVESRYDPDMGTLSMVFS